ncbi:MAG: hypothetical protein ACTTKP_04030 [Catonella sp.]|uniref:hypothetical protein n=1 Tax=Catonella sp. TaxID=2382125 RepID=UPI003F9F3908
MKRKLRYKVFILAVVAASFQVGMTSASADDKLDRIKNIFEQNSNQDNNTVKNSEQNTEKSPIEKAAESNIEKNIIEKESEDNIDDEDDEETESKEQNTEKVSLVENYKEEYKTYEEIMGDEHFFYSSVGNGGWTDKKVHIEFPAKMKVKVKKDGAAYKYVKGKDFTKKGTYYFTLEVKDDKGKVLTANFHFRIQPKPKKTPEELKAEEELKNKAELDKIAEYEKRLEDFTRGLSGSDMGKNMIPNMGDLLDSNGNNPENNMENGAKSSSEKSEADKGDLETEKKEEPDIGDINNDQITRELEEIEQNESDTKIMDEKGEIKEEEIKKLIGKIDEKEKHAAEKEEVTFDTGSGFFKNALKSGDVFLTNVANGSITNQSVMIAKSDTLTFKLFKDGKLVEDFNPGSYLEEAGSYALYPDSEALSFKAAYKEIKPVFTFRIIGSSPVRDLGILPLSPDTKLIDIQINGKSYTDAAFGKTGQMLKLWKDGSYKITTTDKGGEHTLDVTLDRVSPKLQVTLLENQAQVKYLSDDIVHFELYKDKTLETEGESIDIIEGAGTYRLIVTDRAGNRSEATFSIKYQINQAAVIAIVIVIILIIAGVFFFKRMNKTVKVR